jgi:RHS repeat-associated protein
MGVNQIERPCHTGWRTGDVSNHILPSSTLIKERPMLPSVKIMSQRVQQCFTTAEEAAKTTSFVQRRSKLTGAVFYRARIYSPELDRFLQTDPLGYVDGLDLYVYVRNNPENRSAGPGASQRGREDSPDFFRPVFPFKSYLNSDTHF